MLDELLSIALIGTARGGASAALPAALQDAATAVAGPTPEQQLLSQTALINAYLRCGRKATASADSTDPAPPDVVPVCSAAAADLLSKFILDKESPLIAEWLKAAAAKRQRVPHRLLPNLLELTRREKSLRDAAVAVIDQRGRWLMRQNPDWQFAAVDETPDENLWETGTAEQRIAVLRQLRKTDPARAAVLLMKTWKDDPADQRAEFLSQFAVGLSPADEAMLEPMLDDRSKQVRTIAADLLGRLGPSQLVRRMTARAEPLLTFKRGLLKGIKLEVTLPAELDKAAQRDGIERTPPQGIGEKQWWLQQMISFVPLNTWTEAGGISPTEIIAAVSKTDFADAILSGFVGAAGRNPDPLWIDPLLRNDAKQRGRLNRVLLDQLPPQQFLGLAVDVLRDSGVNLVICSDLINNHNIPLDLRAARVWVEIVGRLALRASGGDTLIPGHLAHQCASRVPPGVIKEVEAHWLVEKEPWIHHRGSVEKLLKILDLRQQIQKEFGS